MISNSYGLYLNPLLTLVLPMFITRTTKDDAFRIWFELPVKTYVFLSSDNRILGSYYVKNRPGLGSHVCRCGYLVNQMLVDKVLARPCRHSVSRGARFGI